ncbi:MAG: 4-alpha-glucanotransferase [Chloroflexota bacterium]
MAQRYGVLVDYVDALGERRRAAPEPLMHVLKALGAEMEDIQDAYDAGEKKRWETWGPHCDPVAIAWDGELAVEVRLKSKLSGRTIRCTVHYEDGDEESGEINLKEQKVLGAARFKEHGGIIARRTIVPFEVRPGYHRLTLELPESVEEVRVISAPRTTYQGPGRKLWGAFLPVYAIRSEAEGHWGAGNLTDLGNLYDWVRSQGGDLVGTLPILPTFLDDPFDPSPYAPVSRLFWNEFYIDATQLPEWERSEEARLLAADVDFQQTVAELRAQDTVDYRRGMELRRRVLELLAKSMDGGRQSALDAWADRHPEARTYAAFRAAMEKRGEPFYNWPENMRSGEIPVDEYDPEVAHYYLYTQFAAEEQVRGLSDRTRESGSGLYIDLALGVHSDGYDIWKNPDLFVRGVSLGAPPDGLHAEGQGWGFPPVHPDRLAQQEYQYVIDVIRHHMQFAATLRIDHVMGLHRQFLIPDGWGPKDGMYLKYPSEPLYAIISLESHRNETIVVGEDLGTVPQDVRPSMEEHGIARTMVVPFALHHGEDGLRHLPARAMVSPDTHDVPPFATNFDQFDSQQRRILLDTLREADLLDPEAEEDVEAVFKALLNYLAEGDCQILMVNLEDLWLETHQQNVPGTTIDEHPNWQQKARYTLEELSQMEGISALLAEIRDRRHAAPFEVHDHIEEESSKTA